MFVYLLIADKDSIMVFDSLYLAESYRDSVPEVTFTIKEAHVYGLSK